MSREIPGTTLTLVLQVVREILGRRGATVQEDTPLAGAPGFDSLKLMTIVETLERRLGTTFPPELLLPATFATPRQLARALDGVGVP
jgi:acyl carrier protein